MLHYKAYPQLKEALQAFIKVKTPKRFTVTITVIDNESNEKELKKIKKLFPSVIFLSQKENLGVPAGFNVGYKYGVDHGADFLMMISPDLRIENDVLEKLSNAMLEDLTIGIASCKMLLKTVPSRIFFVQGKLDPKRKSSDHVGLFEVDKGQYDNTQVTDFLNCPLLIRREIFEKVGFFRPEFFMYYEDIDWHTRIKKAGYKLVCIKDAITWNLEIFDSTKVNARKEYYTARNLLYYVKLNYDLKDQLIAYIYTIKEAIGLLFNLLKGRDMKKSHYKLLGMKDFLIGKTGRKDFDF